MPEQQHAILDDFDSRPGSATSLIRTVLGAYRHELGGWVAIAELVELMLPLGVAAEATRIAVTRLKRRGVLESAARDGRPGYRLTAQAEAMYDRGDRRIFEFRRMADDDPWRLISFTLPESLRAARHQLRRRLGWIGCGTVSPGLWIAPEYLTEEIGDIVAALRLTEYVTTFRCDGMSIPDTPAATAARWWDLDGIATRHREFLARHEATMRAAREFAPHEAFVKFVLLLDEWRIIPYVDPGLPASMLPADWPGESSVDLFADARDRCLASSREWVRGLRD